MLATIDKIDGNVVLLLGAQRLSLEKLAPAKVEWLSRLSTPLLIEVTLDGTVVLALGNVQPHPKVAAVRAAADARFKAALEAIAELHPDHVESDLALLDARMRSRFGVGQTAEGAADFAIYCQHAAVTAHLLEEAFRRIPEPARVACVPALVRRVESMTEARVRGFVIMTGTAPWSAEALLRAAEEAADDRSEYLLVEAEQYVAAARDRSNDRPRIDAILARIAKGRAFLANQAKKRAAKLLASRPSFDDVEALFAVRLPPPLRAAWERHYAGDTVGCGFIEAAKGKLDKLTKLATKLGKELERAERLDGKVVRVAVDDIPFRLVPFGMGEHDDEYFALDLACPTGSGDFAVVVVFAGRGEAWQNNTSSTEWLAEGGVTHH